VDFCLGTGCGIEVEVESVNVSDNQPGSIMLTASGGSNYEYSIDGGTTFQNNPVFDGLEAGEYEVVVKTDVFGCQFSQTVTIETDIITSTNPQSETAISISPNPTNGIVSLSLSGHFEVTGFLEVEVLNLNGKVLQKKKFNRYNDSFKGTLSLYDYPKGIYFIRIKNINSNKLSRIIKY